MTPEARAHFKKLEENKRRLYPAKNISDAHPKGGSVVCSIQPGMCGLVSSVELAQHRVHLKAIEVDGWSNEGFEEGDPIKKQKTATGGPDSDEK